MSDEQDTTGQEGATPASESDETSSEKTYSEAEVNAQMAALRRKYEAKLADKKPARQSKPAKKAEAQDDGPSAADVMEELKRLRGEVKFEGAVNELGLKLDHKQKRILKVAFADDSPDDAVAWFRDNWTVPDAPETKTQETTPPAATPDTRPVSDQGHLASRRSWEHEDDPSKWTGEDLARMKVEKGNEFYSYVRKRLDQWLKDVTLVSPKRAH